MPAGLALPQPRPADDGVAGRSVAGSPSRAGRSPGGPDHLAAHLLAQAVGLDPRRVDYVEFDGGGDLLAALLGDRVAFGVSSPTEFRDQIQAGQLRVLAVTSAQRVPGVDAPTLREAGVDLQFANWRGLVAPPGLADADRRALSRLVDGMRGSPEWAQVLARMNVTDAYLTGDEFGAVPAVGGRAGRGRPAPARSGSLTERAPQRPGRAVRQA